MEPGTVPELVRDGGTDLAMGVNARGGLGWVFVPPSGHARPRGYF